METISFMTPIGRLEIQGSAERISGVRYLGAQKPAKSRRGNALLAALKGDLIRYFNEGVYDFSRYQLDFGKAGGFEKGVWKKARTIAFGAVCSYSQLARQVGRPRAARAVGNALGKNPFLIVVPCHRIIRSDGTPGGFGPGPEKKWRLLAHEKGERVFKSLPGSK